MHKHDDILVIAALLLSRIMRMIHPIRCVTGVQLTIAC